MLLTVYEELKLLSRIKRRSPWKCGHAINNDGIWSEREQVKAGRKLAELGSGLDIPGNRFFEGRNSPAIASL